MPKTKAARKARRSAAKRDVSLSAAALTPAPPVRGRQRFLRVADGAVMEVQPTRGTKTLRNVSTEPLEYYKRRSTLTAQQFKAGATLRSSFRTAGILKMSSNVFEPSSHGGADDNWRFGERQANALRVYMQAMKSASRVSRIFLRRCCCLGEWAGKVAVELGLEERYGVDRLREALEDLAEHYRQPASIDPLRAHDLREEMKRVLGPKAAKERLDVQFQPPI